MTTTDLTHEEFAEVQKQVWTAKNIQKYISVTSTAAKQKAVVKQVAGVPMYYPVGFDGKMRQYMQGHPINPQGAKETRPLFKMLDESGTPKAQSLADVEAQAVDLFGADRWAEVSAKAQELVKDYMNPKTIAACSTKGKPSIAMYALLKEYAELTA